MNFWDVNYSFSIPCNNIIIFRQFFLENYHKAVYYNSTIIFRKHAWFVLSNTFDIDYMCFIYTMSNICNIITNQIG